MATLASRITDLSTAVANYIRDSVKPRLLPSGGAQGQGLAKLNTTDYQVGWASFLRYDAAQTLTPAQRQQLRLNERSFGAQVTYLNASVTLIASDAGAHINFRSGAYTITLPVRTTLTPGDFFIITNISSSNQILTMASGDSGTIWYLVPGQGNTTVTINSGQSVVVFYDGTDFVLSGYYQPYFGFTPVRQGGGTGQFNNILRLGWDNAQHILAQVDGVNLGALWSDYTSARSLQTNGYQRLPSGLLLQWGYNSTAQSDVAIALPMTFPNAILSIGGSVNAAPAGALSYTFGAQPNNNGNISFFRRQISGGTVSVSNQPFYWFAIGF